LSLSDNDPQFNSKRVAFAAAAPSLARLTDAAYYPLHVPVPHPSWSVFNPSISRDPAGGFRCLFRYSSFPATRNMQARSYLIYGHINSQYELTHCRQLKDYADRPLISHFGTSFGPEDARLFSFDRRWFASATFGDDPNCVHSGRAFTCMGLLEFDDDMNWSGYAALPARRGQYEKNWMPIESTMSWLYVPSNTFRVQYDLAAAKTVARPGVETSPRLRYSRGGSQLIDIGNGRLLGVTHDVVYSARSAMPGYYRAYVHRFVEYSTAPFALTGISPPFHFLTPSSIEFAAGLARENGKIVISFGHHDLSSWLAVMDLEHVRAALFAP
jgi:hypothetical protein